MGRVSDPFAPLRSATDARTASEYMDAAIDQQECPLYITTLRNLDVTGTWTYSTVFNTTAMTRAIATIVEKTVKPFKHLWPYFSSVWNQLCVLLFGGQVAHLAHHGDGVPHDLGLFRVFLLYCLPQRNAEAVISIRVAGHARGSGLT